jgi:biopolymer transport protein ExbD
MRRVKDKTQAELNLLPIMNLFVALIPFLLVGTAFFHMSVLNVSVPTQTDGLDVSDMANKKKIVKVVMTVQISKKGFKVFGMSEDLSLRELHGLTKHFGKEKKSYDFSRLSYHLSLVKRRYRKSDTVIIVPDKDIAYETIIQTIDAARKQKYGEKERFMFTNVVVTSKV